MNNKILVLLLFAAWSFLCWRMYVCKIKQVCPGQTAQIVQNAATPIADTVSSITSKTDQHPEENTQPTENTAIAEDLKSEVRTADTKVESSTKSSTSEDHISIEETADEAVIHFPYNSVKKVENEEMDAYLSKLAQRLNASNEKVLITGHTDSVGDAVSNEKVALERANGIKAILVKKGVSAKLITCRSFGERKPVASDDTPKGRYQNRRVVISVQ